MPILSAQGISQHVGDRWLWRDLSFTLNPGDCLGITGPSGVGKTLLLRALARLDLLADGAIFLDGRPAMAWPAPEYRARVLFVHQRPVLLEGTVEENFRAVFALHVRRGVTFQPSTAVEWLERLGRSHGLMGQRVEDLSGGERQSVALARALLCAPEVLLLDEPTASLDAALALKAEDAVAAWLGADGGRAAVWVSHDPAQLQRAATRRLDLGDGHA